MDTWIMHIMEEFGYLGVLFLLALENIFPPIPSEVILTFGGFMTTKTNLTIGGVVIASTIGSVIGAVVLYGIGRFLDAQRLEKIVTKWGRYLRLTVEDVQKANQWFQKHGVWTVFFCRFIPLIRSLISIPAGMSRMPLGIFLVLTTAGSLIWNLVLINIGAKVGSSWTTIVAYMDMYSHVVYAGIVLVFLGAVIWFIRKRFLPKTNKIVNK